MRKSITITLNRKAIVLSLALVLLLGGSIGSTLAWLSDETDEVVNTFTYGDISIGLAETDADGDTVQANAYTILPGVDITKDPTLTVEAGSEACWLFVEVDESLELFTDDNGENPKVTYTLLFDEDDSAWKAGTGTDGNGVPVGVYYISQAATGETAVTYSLIVDDTITVSDSLTKEDIADFYDNLTGDIISFTAYAVQSASVETAADAWAIAKPAESTDSTETA